MFAATCGSGRKRNGEQCSPLQLEIALFSNVHSSAGYPSTGFAGPPPLVRGGSAPDPWSVGRPDPGRRAVCRSVGRRPEVWPPYADP